MPPKKLRILIAKCGLDGHSRGAKIVASALKDAGFEVIYTGLRQTPEMIVQAAIQEDVDCVGVSVLSGAHMAVFSEIFRIMTEKGGSDIMVFGGGIIPKEDIRDLEEMGVKKIFTPGTYTSEIVDFLNDWTGRKE